MLELSRILNHLAKIVLYDNPNSSHRTADDDIAKSNVMFVAGCSSSGADHEPNPNRLEASYHVFGHACGRSNSISSFREARDDNAMLTDTAETIGVIVVRLGWQRRIFVIEEGAGCHELLRIAQIQPTVKSS